MRINDAIRIAVNCAEKYENELRNRNLLFLFQDKGCRIPFCSHGGGRFGQSLTAIAKLAPNAVMGQALAINYSGGAAMPGDVSAWLDENGIERK